MNQPTVKKRFPAWLRGLGWFSFGLLGLATLLLVTRWCLMANSHQRAMRMVKQGEALAKGSPEKAVGSSAQKESAVPRGTPLADLPMMGILMGSDSAEKRELEKKLQEMQEFLKYPMLRESRVDGTLSFRTLLAKMGIPVPEAMTESEAAAEFLKQADRFSGVLAQWREAVGKGPWDGGLVEGSDRNGPLNLARGVRDLLGTMVEARLRTGDAAAAWSDWTTLGLSADRCVDSRSMNAGMYASSIRREMFRAARAGMELGVWTDDQLAQISTTLSGENALASMRRDVEAEKISVADSFARIRESDSMLTQPFLHTDSTFESMVNSIGVTLTSDQQIEDNLAVLIQRMDQPLTRFDPDTGIYLPPSADELAAPADSNHSGLSFDRFYFMYSDLWGGPTAFNFVSNQIIKNQSVIDQSRIAAALEMQQRATGEYPETLDAVSGTFGGSTPIDIATGKPYFYQRNPDGGYTLWGAGVDGKSDGGDERTDVTWKHRPVKGK